MAIKGELTVKEYPQAEVYKWVAVFETENGDTFEGFGETKKDALNELAIQVESYDKP